MWKTDPGEWGRHCEKTDHVIIRPLELDRTGFEKES